MQSLREDLAQLRGEWPALAAAAGCGYFTLARVARGATGNPRIETYAAIRRAIDQRKAAGRA